MTNTKSFRIALVASTFLWPFAASPAFAADQVQDIVVTAQKREEKLQEVPIAITALGSEQLQARGIATTQDLSAIAPNVTTGVTSAGGGDTTITMRGLGASDTLMSNDYPVGVYIDGVINARISGSVLDLADLERVEVLRGPQGTLYGRNTTGGAVNFITRKPSKEFHVEQKLGYSGSDQGGGLTSRTTLDTGEWGDTGLSATVNFLYKKIDGYYDNTAQPSDKDPGAENVRAIRLALNYDRGGRFRSSYTLYNVAQEIGNPIPQITGVSPGFAALLLSPIDIQRSRQDTVNLPYSGTDDVDLTLHNFTAEYDVTDNIVVKSITGYRRYQDNTAGPQFGNVVSYLTLTASPPYFAVQQNVPFLGNNARTHEQFTQELQLNGQYGEAVPGGPRLTYTTGAYYFKERASEHNPQNYIVDGNLIPAAYGGPFPGFGFLTSNPFAFNASTESWAVYGQASYTPNILSDKLRLTGGLRYSADEKAVTLKRSATIFVPILGQGDEKFNALTYLAKAQYFFSDDLNAYVSYSKGYKAGGFNTRSAGLEPFRPEKLKALEVGLKASWLDRRLQTNVAAFFNEAEDQQVAQFVAGAGGATNVVTNAGKSEYQGIEFEIVAKPIEGVTMDLNMGFVNPEYKKYETADPLTLLPFDAANVARFGYTSQTTGAAGIQYDSKPLPSLGEGKLMARVEAIWQSKQDFHPAIVYPSGWKDNPLIDTTTSDARTIINARLALNDVSIGNAPRFDVSLWAKNLFDEAYVIQGIDFGALGFAEQTYGAPRTFGLDVSVKY